MNTSKITRKIIKPEFIKNCCIVHYSISKTINKGELEKIQLKVSIEHLNNIDLNIFLNYFTLINKNLKLTYHKHYQFVDSNNTIGTDLYFQIIDKNIISNLLDNKNNYYSNDIYDYICLLLDFPIISNTIKSINAI